MTAVDWLQPLPQGSVISCQTVETFPGRQVPLLFGRRLQLSFLQHEIPEAIPVSLKALFQKSESSGEGHSVSLDGLQSCQDSYSPGLPCSLPSMGREDCGAQSPAQWTVLGICDMWVDHWLLQYLGHISSQGCCHCGHSMCPRGRVSQYQGRREWVGTAGGPVSLPHPLTVSV